MESFEFKTDDLYYSNIERKILNYYNLGFANTSDFIELEEGIGNEYYISATKGDIKFSATVGRTPDNQYLVMIYPKKITRSKR